MKYTLAAVLYKEEDMYVALCPELDIASQGDTIEEAKNSLREAISLFFECASKEETQGRLHKEMYISPIEIAIV